MIEVHESPKTIFLKDYQSPEYAIESIDLMFDLYDEKVLVQSTLKIKKLKKVSESLVLYGEKLVLQSVKLDNRLLSPHEYQTDAKTLTLFNVPDHFLLEIKTEIYPHQNTELSGLFKSKALFCTQCEPEGFRRITYYLDRPDVLSRFTTTIYADKKRYPVLLSNGNCIETGSVDEKRHWVKWQDPFLKPSYLFALVAGSLVAIEDYFITQSGRLVTLKIYVEPQNLDKCQHAMEALKKAMRWDEVTFGREYDLDIYMIVAVNDFNMGAMENKGLNIFNSKYILARPETATDFDYQYIDAVVGHEYFHNWSGNRVTCRDWFQLSLKEGLTVFREHQFSSDINESPVSLIENVKVLRLSQFAEDASPMAHPVRPESYIEINNFYTATIYEKGAEVIRMLKILLGKEMFRKGMDFYFEENDGKAVTTDDFVAAMAQVSGRDLSQFKLWYQQAGTPEITAEEHFDEKTKVYRLTLKQYCPKTPNQSEKAPMVIPIAVGLLDKTGKNILPDTKILTLTQAEETFSFENMASMPVLSLLRGFSAPVKIKTNFSEVHLAFLLANDTDDFNRWDAGQKLTEQLIFKLVEDHQGNRSLSVPQLWLESYRTFLLNDNMNPALKAELLSLPSLSYLLDLGVSSDIDAVAEVRLFLKKTLANELNAIFKSLYTKYHSTERYQYTPEAVAARSLKNICLNYLMVANVNQDGILLCEKQWTQTHNMTDKLGVLGALSAFEGEMRQRLLDAFFEEWKHDPLVLDKWFKLQALSELSTTLNTVKKLMEHPAFEITNPNKVYALIGGFSANLVCFHEKSGAGYTFLADTVLKLDALNPLVAARMVRPLSHFSRLDTERQAKMKKALGRIKAAPTLSRDVFEVVSKSLA